MEHETSWIDDVDQLSRFGPQGARQVASIATFDYGPTALTSRKESRQT
jgi:hypothetical protein